MNAQGYALLADVPHMSKSGLPHAGDSLFVLLGEATRCHAHLRAAQAKRDVIATSSRMEGTTAFSAAREAEAAAARCLNHEELAKMFRS